MCDNSSDLNSLRVARDRLARGCAAKHCGNYTYGLRVTPGSEGRLTVGQLLGLCGDNQALSMVELIETFDGLKPANGLLEFAGS